MLSLDRPLDRIAQHIIRAKLFLDLWAYFEEYESRQHIIETMWDYNEFFRFTPHACLVSYFIYIAGAFDKTANTISFVHLIPEMRAAAHLVGEREAAVDALTQAAAPIIKKVRILRHKAIAHRDAHISYDDVFKLAAVTPDQLRDLTEIALQIANHMLAARGLGQQDFNDEVRKAAAKMMKALAARS
jgi:hypothetical protein